MKVLERDNVVHELESALEHLRLQCDRRLTLQQKEHEQKMQLLLQHFKDQDGDSIIETLKNYEDKIQQLEKDLYFYKKTSRDLKKRLKDPAQGAAQWQRTLTEHHDAGDGVLNPEETTVLSEELKWASRTENTKLNGSEREVDNSSSSLKTQPLTQQIPEDGPDSLPARSSIAPSSGQLQSIADKTEARPFTHSQSPVPHQFQPVRSIGPLQGVKPVKLCRRELRQISAMELSLRRCSLGAGGRSMTADSLEDPEEN